MEFKPAQRKRAKLRLAIAGPSGSGKTYSNVMAFAELLLIERNDIDCFKASDLSQEG